MSTEIEHRTIAVNGIQMHVATCGEGPPALLCGGWSELWYSWRHQLVALAPRGYGATRAPENVEACTILHLVAK